MWKPKSPYWPVDNRGAVSMNLVVTRNEYGEVEEFAGTLKGFGYRQSSEQSHFVLAWRKPGTSSFAVYMWHAGIQERIGTVLPKFVHGLDMNDFGVVE